MKTIIAGPRDYFDYSVLQKAISDSAFNVSVVVSGGASGVDSMGERYAKENNLQLLRFPADWHKHGKKAGFIRNTEMSNNAESLIAIWDGKSKGTGMMIDIAKKKGLNVFVCMISR